MTAEKTDKRSDPSEPTEDLALNQPAEIPIDGVLDLHTFQPPDLKRLVPDYLEACQQKEILEVRIIHGKGIGNLRRSVEALLARLPLVESFSPASKLYGGEGATIVRLRRLSSAEEPRQS